jgi:hypothetical protein
MLEVLWFPHPARNAHAAMVAMMTFLTSFSRWIFDDGKG